MKKIAGRAAAMAMAVVMMSGASGMGVLAKQTQTDSSLSSQVLYNVKQGFEWSIHDDITLKDNQKVEGTVKVSNNTIPVGEYIKISVSGSGTDGVFSVVNTNGNNKKELTYKIYDGNGENAKEIQPGGDVLRVDAGETGSQDLYFLIDTHTKDTSGDYTGTVTYTVQAYNASNEKVNMPNKD